ncbi:hypothetical protein E4U43_003224 [Claviceps pusilla]|uniref:Uncharacterized protein n=1 Tax=Claviceps pusilla TaxID=123648 RepID=A0A9P7N6B7_9HYPO|nr:hypothetical protein E4U43_003224 [Claviceps pusilla]
MAWEKSLVTSPSSAAAAAAAAAAATATEESVAQSPSAAVAPSATERIKVHKENVARTRRGRPRPSLVSTDSGKERVAGGGVRQLLRGAK